jgi:PAS domain S-box-containing protein
MDHHSHHLHEAASASDTLAAFFSQMGFMPHGHCYLWRPALVWTHVLSDMLIGLAYVSISLTLYALVRKIRLPFSSMVLSFGVFIGACGATHFMEVWNLWNADYWAGGFVKVLTAIASVATGAWLIHLRPQILTVAESVKLVAQQKLDLEELNRTLEDQVRVRTRELMQRELEFRTMADSIPQLAWMAEADGSVTWYNRRWLDFTGMAMEEIRGWGWQKVIHPAYVEALTSSWKEGVASGSPLEQEFPIRRADGQFRWFLTRVIPLKDEEGKVVRWFGTNTDIHEKKEAETRVKEAGEQFRLITEAIPQLVWRCNPDGSADYFSQAFLEYFGFGAEEMLGWGWSEVVHPGDRPRVLEEWALRREREEPVSIEFRVKNAEGNYRWFLSLGKPFRNELGKVIKYYGTWTDIDEQRRNREELQRALRVKDEFISVASHELKTPVTSMKLQTQMMARSLKRLGHTAVDPVQLDRLITMSAKQLDRLNRLVDDMLEISRIGAGRFTVTPAPTDLSQLVREVAERYSQRLFGPESNIKLSVEDGIVGEWDSFRMEQVVDNLISNAIKYGEGRPIEISLGRKPQNEVELCVADQGIGIPKEHQNRIFRRFERAVSASHISGLGLGLYIVNTIVRLHQGRISVESEPGNGSRFTVRLPLSQEK